MCTTWYVPSSLGSTFLYRFFASAPGGISSMVTMLEGIFCAIQTQKEDSAFSNYLIQSYYVQYTISKYNLQQIH